ncbi:MAG: Fur family transcriptional regulator [Candidatus Fimenecus sp.]
MPIERKSRQRDAILADLKSRYDHPTAKELYYSVRKSIPNLSLGTLYRNLSQLEENGQIIRIPDEANDRFDGNIAPHAHFKCLSCGKLYDIMSIKNDSYDFSDENIGQIYGYSLMLFGKCKSCSENRGNKN